MTTYLGTTDTRKVAHYDASATDKGATIRFDVSDGCAHWRESAERWSRAFVRRDRQARKWLHMLQMSSTIAEAQDVNLHALCAEIERLQYALKMETIRAEHAESDIGGVREEQWYEARNRELEAEIERLRAENRLLLEAEG